LSDSRSFTIELLRIVLIGHTVGCWNLLLENLRRVIPATVENALISHQRGLMCISLQAVILGHPHNRFIEILIGLALSLHQLILILLVLFVRLAARIILRHIAHRAHIFAHSEIGSIDIALHQAHLVHAFGLRNPSQLIFHS
jgi:hypothetical protein